MRAGFDWEQASGTPEPHLLFHYRYGLHDFLDLQTGYPESTSLELLSFGMRVTPASGAVQLDHVLLARLVRLPPLTRSWEELSWRVELGSRQVRGTACGNCQAGNALGGIGATVAPLNWLHLWVMAEAEILVSGAWVGFPVAPSVGPRLGVRLRLAPWLNALSDVSYRYQFHLPQPEWLEWTTRLAVALGRNWSLQAQLGWDSGGYFTRAGVYTYF